MRIIIFLLILAVFCQSAFAQTDATTPLHLLKPNYPIPYGIPKPEKVTQEKENKDLDVKVISQRWYEKAKLRKPLAPNSAEMKTPSPSINSQVDGRTPGLNNSFVYEATFKNATVRTVKGIIWEYVFSRLENNEELQRHKFTNILNIGKGKTRQVEGFSPSPPTHLIIAADMINDWKSPYRESIYFRCMIFDDDTIWKNENVGWDECKELAIAVRRR